MTPSGVHPDEMPSYDPLADPALAAFLDDLEVVTDRSAPAPGPGLAAFLDGISPESPLADSWAPAAPRATRRRKMIVSELLGALVAKLAGLGMVAKAGLGLGMAAASVTTAGVANVLPDPAQHAVATVVNAVAPFEIADPSDITDDPEGAVDDITDDVTDDVTDDLPKVPEVTVPGTGEDDGDGAGTGTDRARSNHGACVSAVARDKTTQGSPGSHGKAVSEAARSDCGKDVAGSPTTTVPSTTTTIAPTTTVPEVDASSNRSPGNGNAGRGNGNAGRGNGNAGNGNGNAGRR